MIKNELEYSVTKSWVEKFSRALAVLDRDEEKKKNDPDGWQLHHDGVESQLLDFRDEIDEYEALIAHDRDRPVVLTLEDINRISDILIKTRIALKITEKELGYLCDRTEEQIKAYEDKNYGNASFLDFIAVADALGIQVREGRFFAGLNDSYKEHLAGIRQAENLSSHIKVS